jgi:hypothetical protein
VLVAQACNVGYKPLVDESNPALREARLRYVAQRYLRPETLAAANARIVDFHAKLPLAERWGGGEVASIDGLRFVVPRRTIHAAYNRPPPIVGRLAARFRSAGVRGRPGQRGRSPRTRVPPRAELESRP